MHLGAFLSLAEAIGGREAKEAGQVAAGSVPPLEPGDAAQELSVCRLSPESRLLLRFLLRLRSCCYPRTSRGWFWVSAGPGGTESGPGGAGRSDLWGQRLSRGGEAPELCLRAFKF